MNSKSFSLLVSGKNIFKDEPNAFCRLNHEMSGKQSWINTYFIVKKELTLSKYPDCKTIMLIQYVSYKRTI